MVVSFPDYLTDFQFVGPQGVVFGITAYILLLQ